MLGAVYQQELGHLIDRTLAQGDDALGRLGTWHNTYSVVVIALYSLGNANW